MGFRNPLTSATVTDTGQPATAGARLYQGSDAAGVFGVLEFRDGVAGDAPSKLTGRANLVPQGDGSYTAQGGRLTLEAGSWNGLPGPKLNLAVAEASGGGYESVLTVTAGRMDINAPLKADNLTSLGAVASGGRGNAAVHPAAAAVSGAALPATGVPILRSGSNVITLNANGDGTVPFPAFPNGLLTFIPAPGDGNAALLQSVSVIGHALNSVNVRGRQANGGIPTGNVRINWLAIGW